MAETALGPAALTPPAGATAAQWSAKWFGGPTRSRQISVTVLTTVTRILPNNPRRVFWSTMNRSVNDGSIGDSNELTFTTGQLLGALGGVASMAVQEDGEAVAHEVTGIQNAASGAWWVVEIERI